MLGGEKKKTEKKKKGEIGKPKRVREVSIVVPSEKLKSRPTGGGVG